MLLKMNIILVHGYPRLSKQVRPVGQPNDGLVTLPSAQWATIDPDPWTADHGEEVGNNIDNLLLPPSLPWLAKYD
jgi:hypothetical protein